MGEAAAEVGADPLEAGDGALLLEQAELPDDHLGEGVADRVAVAAGVRDQIVEQIEQVQADLLGVGRVAPRVSCAAPLVPLMLRDGANGDGVAVGAAVRVVGAVGIERAVDRHVADLAVVRLGVPGVPAPVAVAAVLAIEPAGAAAVGSSIRHGHAKITRHLDDAEPSRVVVRCAPASDNQDEHVVAAPKFYFGDVGVVNFLATRGALQPGGELFGKARCSECSPAERKQAIIGKMASEARRSDRDRPRIGQGLLRCVPGRV